VPEICVDASFIVKLVLPEPKHELVRAQWSGWLGQGMTIVAPWLWLFEVHSVLRRKVVRQELGEVHAAHVWRLLRRQGIRTVHPRGLFDRAWVVAAELGRSTTYDAVYVAAAALRGCDLWTADDRLARSAQAKFDWIRLL
jgi:predicted nucleic acid-binding protein